MIQIGRRAGNQIIAALASALAIGLTAARPAAAQRAGKAAALGVLPHAGVVVFVNPLTASTARIGVAYDHIVSRHQVELDLAALLTSGGWSSGGDLEISTASAHPQLGGKSPPTTAAMLTVVNAPQMLDGNPELLPYIQAFQRVSRLEVIFLTDTQARGTATVDNRDYQVQIIPASGIQRYEVLIRQHKGLLPPYNPAPEAASQPALPARPSAQAANPLPSSLLFSGLVLIAVAGIGSICYFWMAGRSQKAIRSGPVMMKIGRKDCQQWP